MATDDHIFTYYFSDDDFYDDEDSDLSDFEENWKFLNNFRAKPGIAINNESNADASQSKAQIKMMIMIKMINSR